MERAIDTWGDEPPRHFKTGVPARRKKYGIQTWSHWTKQWRQWRWYPTERSRDQAYESLKKHTVVLIGTPWDAPVRKVNR
jgi:hypothetical protein